jgi:hypothetical protein
VLGFVETAQTGNVMTLRVYLLVEGKRITVSIKDTRKISPIYDTENLIGFKTDEQEHIFKGTIYSFKIMQ